MFSGLVYLRRRSIDTWETSVDRVIWELLTADCTQEALAAASARVDRGLVALIGPETGKRSTRAREA